MITFKVSKIVLIFTLLAIIISVKGQVDPFQYDACYGRSVSVGIVDTTISSGGIPDEILNSTDLSLLANVLYQGLYSTLSPYGFSVGLGYLDNSFVYLQRCYPYTASCAYVDPDTVIFLAVSPEVYGDYNLRYFRVIYNNDSTVTIDPSNPVAVTDPFKCTTRPWFNSTFWSPAYVFLNTLSESRSYVRTIEDSGVRVISDRNPEEPCNACYSRSPCAGISSYIAAKAPLSDWENNNDDRTKVLSTLQQLLKNYMQPWQLQLTINAIGFGFNRTGDCYIVTDCNATPAKPPECAYAPYIYEVRNEVVYQNDHLHLYAVDNDGNVMSETPRDEGVTFNTRVRPWYVRGSGWSDNYGLVNVGYNGSQILPARGYTHLFYNGVVNCVVNVNNICPGIISQRGVDSFGTRSSSI